MNGLTEGRIVHYVLPNGPSKGEHRPAIVVKVWNKETGYINLQVFLDGGNDTEPLFDDADIAWKTSIEYSETPEPNTWHWIEPA